MNNSSHPSIFPSNVKTFLSNRSVDFVLKAGQREFDDTQKKYLEEQLYFSLDNIFNFRQVHADAVIEVTGKLLETENFMLEADGAVANVPGVALAVRTADCLPILFCDTEGKCIGIAHAGWRSTYKQIAVKVLKAMQDNCGTQPQDVIVGFFPSIQKCCYEVGREMKDMFPGEIVKDAGKCFLDLPLTNKRQLLALGVLEENISEAQECTCCSNEYFSFRREGDKAGRHLSLIMI